LWAYHHRLYRAVYTFLVTLADKTSMSDFDDYSMLDFDEQNTTPEKKEYAPDPITQNVKKLIIERLASDAERVYYQRQFEVIFEKQFFHWVTDRAIRELTAERKIKIEFIKIQVNGHQDLVKLITNKHNRYFRRSSKRVVELIKEYSHPSVTRDVGLWGQSLFKIAYAARGFQLIGEDTNEYKEKKWRQSKKNLDFILEKEGKGFGCEVKNTLGYMEREEWEEKIKICNFLGITPIFIVRYSPTVWNYEIFKLKGLVHIFREQVYPPGKKILVDRMKIENDLPVMVSEKVPDGVMAPILKVIDKRILGKKL